MSLLQYRCIASGCTQTQMLKYCTRCTIALYCSPSCQSKDWPKHKIACLKNRKRHKLKVFTCLGKALRDGDASTKLVQKATSEEPSIMRYKDEHGFTLLHRAVMFNRVNSLYVLIKAKSPLEIVEERHGFTALMYATMMNNVQAVQLLLAAKADCDVKDKSGISALNDASSRNQTHIVKLLIEAKANVTTTSLYNAVLQDNDHCVKLLLDAKAQVNSRCLFHCVFLNKVTCLKLLLQACNLHIDTRNSQGFSPLMVAAHYGLYECACELVKAKADIAMTDADGFTAYYHAGKCVNSDILALLHA